MIGLVKATLSSFGMRRARTQADSARNVDYPAGLSSHFVACSIRETMFAEVIDSSRVSSVSR